MMRVSFFMMLTFKRLAYEYCGQVCEDECLDECNTCFPCTNDTQQPASCFGNTKEVKKETSFLSQVNELYCLTGQDCKKYIFSGCESNIQAPEFFEDETPGVAITGGGILSDRQPPEPEKSSTTKQRKSRAAKPRPAPEAIEATAASHLIPAADAKSKAQLVNSRLKKYRTAVTQVQDKTNNHPLAAKASVFLTDPAPLPDRLLKLVNEVLQNKVPKAKGNKALTKKQVADLAANVTCYYLDKTCFNGRDTEKLQAVPAMLEKLRAARINVDNIREYWNLTELLQYEPALNETTLKSLFEPRKR